MLFSTERNCPIGSCWGQDQVKECTTRGIRPVLFMFQQLLCGNSNHVVCLQGAGSKRKRAAPAVGDKVANAISNMMSIKDTVAEHAANRAAKQAAADEARGSASAAGAAAEDDDEGDEDEDFQPSRGKAWAKGKKLSVKRKKQISKGMISHVTLTVEQKLEIGKIFQERKMTQAELASKFKVSE